MGLALTRSKDYFEIGKHEDICAHCASSLPASKRREQVGKVTGQRIYKNYTPSGAVFCLCEKCLAELGKSCK